jgi:hypothetical protein
MEGSWAPTPTIMQPLGSTPHHALKAASRFPRTFDLRSTPVSLSGLIADTSLDYARVTDRVKSQKAPPLPFGEMEPSTLINPSRAMVSRRGAPGSRG